MNRLSVSLLATVVALSTAGCEREEDRFASLVAVAEKQWDGVLLEFGSPRALPHLGEDGWSHGETSDDRNTFRWAIAEKASFSLDILAAGKRMLWLECEPFMFDGSPAQWMAISLNGEPLTEVELRPGRERYPIEVPFEAGENVFDLRFRYAGDPNRRSEDRRELAVAFYQAAVSPPGTVPVAGAPSPFSWDGDAFVLPAGGAVVAFADIPGKATLKVTPVEGARADARLSVKARSADGVLVDERHSPDAPWEHRLTHDGPAEIRLGAEGDDVSVRVELFAAAPEPVAASVEPTDANVVVIFLDGANALRMGLYGYDKDTTPNIDALGRGSIIFETAVSQAVYTIASMGSVLTGQYPERHQSVSFSDKLRDDVVTLPGVLGENGFRTAGFSGNSVASSTFGLNQGYEHFVPVWKQDGYTGHGDAVLKAFREWLDSNADERFFAYVHFREPHSPYNPPPPYDTQFGEEGNLPDGEEKAIVDRLNDGNSDDAAVSRVRALYEGNLAYVDALVGELLTCLEDKGLVEDTIIILTADHGEAMFEHGWIGHNTQLYEESIRIPLVVKIPGVEPRRVSELVELLDLPRTLLELLGVPVPPGMQGTSLFSPRADRIAFSRSLWKRARYTARSQSSKLIWDSRTGSKELYDLEADPEETHNAYDRDGFESRYMEHELYSWLRTQEHIRELVPDPTDLSDEERRNFDAGGYTNFLPKRREP